MKIKNRIFLNQKNLTSNQSIEFDIKQSHYLTTVLRSKVGDCISIFNETSEYSVKLTNVERRMTIGTIINELRVINKIKPYHLYFSPIKRIPTEIIIQKCTEIGITHFRPVIMERTQFKTFNIERLKLIAIEAVEQSNQISIPQISIPIHFEDLIKKNDESILACCLDDKAQKINEIYTEANLDIKGVLIGPEGDFSKKEMNMINDNKFITSVSLGNNVLKSETACIVAASLIKEYSNHAE